MPKAYSYLRFSTPEQMKGDSHRRQSTLAAEYAAKHGLDLDDKLTFQDLGVSAFRGKNAEGGQLGVFLAAVHAGKVEPGSYLLVESLDRISRQAARKALRSLEDILEVGITVVTLTDGRVYTREVLDTDPMALIMSILVFIRANEESANKSIRIKQAWTGKRQKAAQKPLTSVAPLWLRLDKETGQWNVLPECVEVVRRIFRDYLAGQGAMSITVALNKEGVPPFFREGREGKKRQAPRWHRNTIRRILSNPAVIGMYTPHVTEYVDGKKQRKAAQKPIPGYFPAIVDEDTFQRVQALLLDTPSPLRGRNASGEVKNLFGGLARCSQCGGTMAYVNKGQPERGTYTYLVCLKARDGAGCKYAALRYQQLEAMFLQNAPRLLGTVSLEAEHGPLEAEIREAESAMTGAEDTLEHLAETYARTRMDTLLKQMRSIEVDKTELQKRLDDLYARAGAVTCPLVTKRIQELEQALQADPLDRRHVNALLRMLFKSVTVDLDSGIAEFAWKHGGTGDVLFGFPRDDAKAGKVAKAA
ncbi:MAG TPA: recombinase family protein [Archangium sp.]|jgi:DNA invertase Pin-like site-specific DNA recombinase|uniref:recombinase family protein n=1 Tax=Archangium sp. TaxID=1872627 RepID=UPI002ED8DF63